MEDWLDVIGDRRSACGAAGDLPGCTDWRLPPLAELLPIVDLSRTPAIDRICGETDGRDYGSTSRDTPIASMATMALNFLNCGAIPFPKASPLHGRAGRADTHLQDGGDSNGPTQTG